VKDGPAAICSICGRPRGSKGHLQNDRRVGWVLTSVRPLMRPFKCRGPVWEFANQVQIRAACSKHFVANWMPDPVSRPLRHTFLPTAPTPSTTSRSRPNLTPPRPELCKLHPSTAAPRRSGLSCWPMPLSRASAACAPAFARATTLPERPSCRLGAPRRCLQ
jgi:hypothetical protein